MEDLLIKYSRDVIRTFPSSFNNTNLLGMGALGTCTEAGEAGDIIKKHLYQGHDLDLLQLKEELGDLLYYWLTTVIAAGLDVEDIINYNMQKRKRLYPNGFSTKRSRNRGG